MVKPAVSTESKESATDLMAKLMGDWSYRPEMQVKDPGHVYTEAERDAFTLLRNDGGTLAALRPWSFPAYKGTAVMPPRIGPVMG